MIPAPACPLAATPLSHHESESFIGFPRNCENYVMMMTPNLYVNVKYSSDLPDIMENRNTDNGPG